MGSGQPIALRHDLDDIATLGKSANSSNSSSKRSRSRSKKRSPSRNSKYDVLDDDIYSPDFEFDSGDLIGDYHRENETVREQSYLETRRDTFQSNTSSSSSDKVFSF
jgi:hypothetical protein